MNNKFRGVHLVLQAWQPPVHFLNDLIMSSQKPQSCSKAYYTNMWSNDTPCLFEWKILKFPHWCDTLL